MASERFDIELYLLSQPRYLCVARAALNAALDKYGFVSDQCARVMLAVDEALTNIMRHGYDGRENEPIWMRVRPEEDNGAASVRIVIEDRARKVDPAEIRGRALKDVRPGGLGVHIIREVMDEVSYEPREDGPGMRLVMTKARTGDVAPQETDAS